MIAENGGVAAMAAASAENARPQGSLFHMLPVPVGTIPGWLDRVAAWATPTSSERRN